MITKLFDMAVPAHPPGSPLVPGEQWFPHRGAKQRRRYMRQRCAPAMKSNVPGIKAVIARLKAACDGGREDPYEEMYPMICEAMHEAEAGGSWVDIVNQQLDQFEQVQGEGES
jgi:hypothetical protein